MAAPPLPLRCRLPPRLGAPAHLARGLGGLRSGGVSFGIVGVRGGALGRWFGSSCGPSCSAVSAAAGGWAAAPPVRLDAVVVLAGGLLEDGGLPLWVTRRVDAAAALYARFDRPKVVLCGGGTPHKPPPLMPSGHPVLESVALGRDLAGRHPDVPLEDVLRETASYDTIGNAYFSLVAHALPRRWTHVAVVTSAFHMPRSEAIFDATWKLPVDAAQPDARAELSYFAVSDEGLMDADDYQARCDRELASREAFLKNAEAWTTLGDFSEWLHATHRCYAVPRQDEYGQPTEATAKELKSY